MRGNWNLAETQFGVFLEFIRRGALEFGYDTIWNCLRIFSMRCDWNLAKKHFGCALEFFRGDAFGIIWLRHNLEFS